jgi:tetratricopeptide (TPR) repeat protein
MNKLSSIFVALNIAKIVAVVYSAGIMSVRDSYTMAALSPHIEVYQQFIGAGKFDEACAWFRERLDKPTLYGLETSLRRAELLLRLFPEGESSLPALSAPADQAFVLHALALTLNLTGGYPGRAILLYEKHDEIAARTGDEVSLSQSLGHHAKALRQAGRFRASEAVARRGLQVIRKRKDSLREAVNLYWLGMGLAHRGAAEESEAALQQSLRIMRDKFAEQAEGVVNAFLAQRALWLNLPEEAAECANRAWEIGAALERDDNHADLHGAAKVAIAAARMQGEALVNLGDNGRGRARLQYALWRAREIEFVEEELPALRVLALAARQEGDAPTARRYLSETWKLAQRGPFTLYDADSYNILAQIEQDCGNTEKAINAATQAYRLSWCDGPPFAYQRGLEDAAAHLARLGVDTPLLPERVKSNFPAMPAGVLKPSGG